MKVAFITPSRLMPTFANAGGVVFVLAHQYLRDEAYAAYVDEASKSGATILLDNGAYEFGESVQNDELGQVAAAIWPDLLVLPDVRFDREATVERARSAIDTFAHPSRKLLAVPQGKSEKDILLSYEQLSDLTGVDGFGLYEEIGNVAGYPSRHRFLSAMEDRGLIDSNKYYHLLGMEENVQQVIRLSTLTWANSIDSCKPIVMGLNGVDVQASSFIPYPHRPANYFALQDNPYPEVLSSNVQKTLIYAGIPFSEALAVEEN